MRKIRLYIMHICTFVKSVHLYFYRLDRCLIRRSYTIKFDFDENREGFSSDEVREKKLLHNCWARSNSIN